MDACAILNELIEYGLIGFTILELAANYCVNFYVMVIIFRVVHLYENTFE